MNVLQGCYPTEKKAEMVGTGGSADTADIREKFTDPTPKDSVTEFGDSEGDADKSPKDKNN